MEADTVTPNDLARLEQKIDHLGGSLGAKLDTLAECINGNGKPGLKTEVALLTARVVQLEAAQTQTGKDWRSLLFPAINYLIAAGLGAALVDILKP